MQRGIAGRSPCEAFTHDPPTSGDGPGGAIGLNLDGRVQIGAQNRGSGSLQRADRGRRRMPIPVTGADADQAGGGMQFGEEAWGGA